MQMTQMLKRVVNGVRSFHNTKLVGAQFRDLRDWYSIPRSSVRTITEGNGKLPGKVGETDINSSERVKSLQSTADMGNIIYDHLKRIGVEGVKKKIAEIEKKIEDVEKKLQDVEKKTDEVKGLSWNTPTAVREEPLQNEGDFEKWKMDKMRELRQQWIQLRKEANQLLQKKRFLLHHDIELRQRTFLLCNTRMWWELNSDTLLQILLTLFPENPQPRTNVGFCASIDTLCDTQLVGRDKPLNELYWRWKNRMFDPMAESPFDMRHSIIAVSCLPGGGKTMFLSHALKDSTYVDKLAEHDPQSWKPFAERFRASIRIFVTFSGDSDMVPEETDLCPSFRLALRMLHAYWFGDAKNMPFRRFASLWLKYAEAPPSRVVLRLINDLSGDLDVFLAVDDILNASKHPDEDVKKYILVHIGELLSVWGPRFHAVVASQGRQIVCDLGTCCGRSVDFVNMKPLSREDSVKLVRNIVGWSTENAQRQDIDLAIGASLGHPQTLRHIGEMILENQVNSANVLSILSKHFETSLVLDRCTPKQLADLLKVAVQAAALGIHPHMPLSMVHMRDYFKIPVDDLIKFGVVMNPVVSSSMPTLETFSPDFFIQCMKRLRKSSDEEHQYLAKALGQIFSVTVDEIPTNRDYISESFHFGFMALHAWALRDGTKSLGTVFSQVKRLKQNDELMSKLRNLLFINKSPLKICETPNGQCVSIGTEAFEGSLRNGRYLALQRTSMENMTFWSKQPSGRDLVVAYDCTSRFSSKTNSQSNLNHLKTKVDEMVRHTSGLDNADLVQIFPVRGTMTPESHEAISNASEMLAFALDETDLKDLYGNMNMSPVLPITDPSKED